MALGIGTRVTHRRYSWMVGYVVLQPMRGFCAVRWDSDRYWGSDPMTEEEGDLRPTPHQPISTQPRKLVIGSTRPDYWLNEDGTETPIP